MWRIFYPHLQFLCVIPRFHIFLCGGEIYKISSSYRGVWQQSSCYVYVVINVNIVQMKNINIYLPDINWHFCRGHKYAIRAGNWFTLWFPFYQKSVVSIILHIVKHQRNLNFTKNMQIFVTCVVDYPNVGEFIKISLIFSTEKEV